MRLHCMNLHVGIRKKSPQVEVQCMCTLYMQCLKPNQVFMRGEGGWKKGQVGGCLWFQYVLVSFHDKFSFSCSTYGENMEVCTHTHTYTHAHARTHTHTHTHTHTIHIIYLLQENTLDIGDIQNLLKVTYSFICGSVHAQYTRKLHFHCTLVPLS